MVRLAAAELDSFSFQTVLHEGAASIAEAMGLPLVRSHECDGVRVYDPRQKPLAVGAPRAPQESRQPADGV